MSQNRKLDIGNKSFQNNKTKPVGPISSKQWSSPMSSQPNPIGIGVGSQNNHLVYQQRISSQPFQGNGRNSM